MTIEQRDIVTYSVESLIKEVAALTMDGWVVSKDGPGDVLAYNNTFVATFVRDADTVAAMKQRAALVGDRPKPTRAEILQKARAARATKKALLDVNTVSVVD